MNTIVFKGRAKSLSQEVEAEINIVLDVMVPLHSVTGSLREFEKMYPDTRLSLSVETLGGGAEACYGRQRHFRHHRAPVAGIPRVDFRSICGRTDGSVRLALTPAGHTKCQPDAGIADRAPTNSAFGSLGIFRWTGLWHYLRNDLERV